MAKISVVSCVWSTKKIAGEPPLPRSGHGLAVINDKVFVFGGAKYEFGKDTDNCELKFFDDMHSFSVAGLLNWTAITQFGNIPPARDSHTMSTCGKDIYLYGGKNQDCCAESLQGSCVWERIEATGSPPMAVGHTASVVGNFIYIFGGLVNGRATDCLKVFDIERKSWHTPSAEGNPPCPRCDHSSEAINDCIYIFGGAAGPDEWLDDLYCLNTSTRIWSQPVIRGLPPMPRCGHSFVAHRDKDIYVFGGWTKVNGRNTVITKIGKLSLGNQKWKTPLCAGQDPPVARHDHCAFVIHSCLYVLGGMCVNGEAPMNMVYCLRLINPSERNMVLTQALKDLERL